MKRALYIPSEIYDNRESVPRDEESGLLSEHSWIMYEDVEHKEYKTGSGIEFKKKERMIDTKAPIKFKTDDVIKIDNVPFKIKEIQITIPENRKKACEMWPQMEIIHSIKRLTLK